MKDDIIQERRRRRDYPSTLNHLHTALVVAAKDLVVGIESCSHLEKQRIEPKDILHFVLAVATGS